MLFCELSLMRLMEYERHWAPFWKTALGVHIKSMAPHDWILQFTYQFNGTSPAPSDHFSCLASSVKCASLKSFSILRNHAPCAIFIIKIRSICMTLISIISHWGSLFWQQLSRRIHGSDLLFHTYRADG